jgi:hypothetical protein
LIFIYNKYPVNVLILTPDGVGSTLLQRLITIYMQFYDFDRPVINLHELTNGLEKYFSPEFNQEIVSKRRVKDWGYHQSLEQIVNLLGSVEHYKTSRLAQYHIRRRQDPIDQQIPFYRYLDENFFVIACRRRNVFEHALSMSINTITKRLNVYSHGEKINAFLDMYADPVDIDQAVLLDQLEAYRQYLAWSQDYFNIGSYFEYDRSIHDMENYILGLPIFKKHGRRITWQQKFGISLDDWNRYHWIPSDIGSLDHARIKHLHADWKSDIQDPVTIYQQLAPPEWPEVHTSADLDDLPEDVRQEFYTLVETNAHDQKLTASLLTPRLSEYLDHYRVPYNNAREAMGRMQELDILVSPPPIKKQTLQDKIRMINNYQQCLETYNSWAEKHSDIVDVMSDEQINAQIQEENRFWRSLASLSSGGSDLLTIPKSECQNDDDHGPNLAFG